MKRNLEKKKQVLKELQNHEHGITVRTLSTITGINPKTASRWLHRLEYEGKAISVQYGSCYAFYPTREDVKKE